MNIYGFINRSFFGVKLKSGYNISNNSLTKKYIYIKQFYGGKVFIFINNENRKKNNWFLSSQSQA